jgi:hypothetical protein
MCCVCIPFWGTLNCRQNEYAMKPTFFLLLTFLFFGQTVDGQSPKIISSDIQHVTVYFDGAVVQRKLTANLISGNNMLVVRDMPEGLIKNQIQVKAPAGTRLMELDYRPLSPEERGMKSLDKLSLSVEKQRDELRMSKARLNAMQSDLKYIDESRPYKTNDNPSVQQFREMDAYLSQRRKELRVGIQQMQNQISELEQVLQAAIAQLELLRQENLKEEYAIVMTVVAAQTTNRQFTLEYFTPLAGWAPMYHVRAGQPSEPVQFELSAQVAQMSGEDWNNCKLTLSTGTPALGGQMPEMLVWNIGPGMPYIPTRRASTSSGINRFGTGMVMVVLKEEGTGIPVPNANLILTINTKTYSGVTDLNGQFRFIGIPLGYASISASSLGYGNTSGSVQIQRGANSGLVLTMRPNNNRRIEEISSQSAGVYAADGGETTFIRGGRSASTTYFIDGVKVKSGLELPEFVEEQTLTTMTYSIDQSYTIPGDGLERTVPISSQSVSANFVHIIRPALDEHAFLMAYITDWEKMNLLKGRANLFLDGAFMGETYINPGQLGDTLALSMGRDQQLVVRRTRVNPRQGRRFLGSTVRHEFNYEITVRNTRSASVDLVVQDQIPISNTREIGVSKVVVGQGGSLDDKTGFVNWRKKVNPTTSDTFTFSFEVSHPSNMTINLPR